MAAAKGSLPNQLGPYEILEEIGRGALGIVYRCRHVHLERLAALKVLHPHWTESPEFLRRFREEGRVMAMLEHPNILRVYDAGEHDGIFYLAMSYVEGSTLEARLRNPISLEESLAITRQLASALAYAHGRGVIHRDLKPANVMVGPDLHVTLMDFGVARLKDSPGHTQPGGRIGTPYYMAPEQIQGRPVDHRADLYALGVVLYRMLTGRLPFGGEATEAVYDGHLHRDPPPLDEDCPAWLATIVLRLLAKSPDERFADAHELIAALDAQSPATAGSAAATHAIPPAPARPAALGAPIRRHCAALSLDVVASSALKQPGLTLVVNERFAAFRRYVRSHLDRFGATDAAWSGDGLVALFNQADDAAACATAILDELDEFNTTGGERPLHVRIGIGYGPVVMWEGQPLGEVASRTLDEAGHLQKAAPPDSALMSEACFRALTVPNRWRGLPPSVSRPTPDPVYIYTPGESATAPPRILRAELRSGGQTREVALHEDTLIGRADPASSRWPDLPITGDDTVSRRHARILRRPDGFYLEDLDSANGTLLNGRYLTPYQPVVLQTGDHVELGEVTHLRIVAIEGTEG